MMYPYLLVDSKGGTIGFYPSESGDKQAAKRLSKKALASSRNCEPYAITIEENLAYPVAVWELRGGERYRKAYK